MNGPVQYLYRKFRGRDLPDDLSLTQQVIWASRYVPMVIRGAARAVRYGSSSSPHFIGRRVQVRNPGNLRIGRGVAFDNDVRISAFGGAGVSLGDSVSLGRFSLIESSAVISEPGVGVTIGGHTAIGSNNTVWGQGGVTIGMYCLFGPNVVIVSEDHNFESTDRPIKFQGSTRAPVSIGDDCWIGANSVITAGVTIGRGAIVAAGSVVTSDVEDFSVVGGVPARLLRSR